MSMKQRRNTSLKKNEYTADLVNKGFWFTEFKKTIELCNEDKSGSEIKILQKEENVYLAPSVDTGRRMASTLVKRAQALPAEVVEQFLSFDIGTQKMINLLAIMENNRLFFEFMYEVYREDRLLGKKELEDSSLRIFFKDKAQQNEKVASFTDATVKRLSGAYKTFLREAGFLEIEGKTSRYQTPVMDQALEELLNNPEWKPYYKAIKGVA